MKICGQNKELTITFKKIESEKLINAPFEVEIKP